jgi:hypothetical protein
MGKSIESTTAEYARLFKGASVVVVPGTVVGGRSVDGTAAVAAEGVVVVAIGVRTVVTVLSTVPDSQAARAIARITRLRRIYGG